MKYYRRARGGKRVSKLHIQLLSKQLVLSARYFKTKKENRSRLQRQIVIPLRGFAVRELVFSFQKATKPKGKRGIGYYFARRPYYAESFALIAGMLGVAYFSASITQPAQFSVSTQSAPISIVPKLPLNAEKALPKSEPTHIKVPKAGIDADLLSVGLNTDGTLETPKSNVMAAWYKLGKTPGEIGPSVIVGHVDSAKEGAAVFYRLNQLQLGDVIEIVRKDGTTARFQVDRIDQFAQNNFPSDQIYGDIDHAGVRLITCGGTYDPKIDRYSHNTVVFGSLII